LAARHDQRRPPFPRMSRDSRICAAICSIGIIGHHFGDHSFLDFAPNASTGQSEPLRKFLALVPGLAGVGVIAWNETSNAQHSVPVGMIALLVASSLFWALGSVYTQRRTAHIRPHDPSPLARTAVCRHAPEVGAVCEQDACPDLCGERGAISVPSCQPAVYCGRRSASA
jgi:hypothetical protein